MSRILRRYADTPGGQVHVRERPGDGPPVLFLHQTPSSSVMWERVMEAYPAGRRLIAIDTPGFGGSDGPAVLPEPGIPWYAARVVEVLDALGLGTVDVVGFHTGAVIATELAASAPARVGRLVLIGMVVTTPEEGRVRLGQAVRWEYDSRGGYVEERLLPHMRSRVVRDDPEHFVRELVSTIQAGPDWWWAYHAVFTYDARERLPLVSAPTLLAVGAEEEEAAHEWARLGARIAPAGEYLRLEGLGVEMCFEEPGRTAAVVADFLAVTAAA